MGKPISTDRLIGRSAWTARIRQRIEQVASYRSNVLISGPTGTGKELVARALHESSTRSEKPFVPVNCAAVPSPLFVSQLFGHEKGAFTGAQFASLGCFRAADGGTIFLDEIGELDLDLQAKLLRVLQDQHVVPVGSHEPVPVNVRMVAATNRDLEAECRNGNFRLDLYYRLNVIVLETEPLENRPEDIEGLAQHILARAAIEHGLPLKRLSREALALFHVHDWPGNVRELQNVLERAVLFSRDEVLGANVFQGLVKSLAMRNVNDRFTADQPPLQLSLQPRPQLDADADIENDKQWLSLAEVEKQHIQRTLEETFHNQSAAAQMLGVDRKLLSRKIKKYGLTLPNKHRGRPSKNPSRVANVVSSTVLSTVLSAEED